jgi:hypothetical protein
MNEIDPSLPPLIPSGFRPSPPLMVLGDNPKERQAIPNIVVLVEALLRQPRRVLYQLRQPGSGRLIAGMILVSLVCSLIYGVVAGTFSMGTQLWAAPIKIAGGLLITAMICLPSLYIFSCLSGSEASLAEICGFGAGLLMVMTILLIGFAPVAWLFSQSTESLAWMGAFHLFFWFVATIFGLRFLEAGFAHSKARSRVGLFTWMIIFLLVAMQMTTALRPILGKADTFLPASKKFFLVHWSDCLNTEPTWSHQASR